MGPSRMQNLQLKSGSTTNRIEVNEVPKSFNDMLHKDQPNGTKSYSRANQVDNPNLYMRLKCFNP